MNANVLYINVLSLGSLVEDPFPPETWLKFLTRWTKVIKEQALIQCKATYPVITLKVKTRLHDTIKVKDNF